MGDEGQPPPAFGTRPAPETTLAFESVPSQPSGPPEVGGTLDDFLLVDRLGQGAFATVSQPHQTSLRRTVALKVSETEDAEAQTLARLDLPHTVRVYDPRDVPSRGVLGVAGCGLTFWFGAEIRRDLEAVARALR